jgi:hypothetical protein
LLDKSLSLGTILASSSYNLSALAKKIALEFLTKDNSL